MGPKNESVLFAGTVRSHFENIRDAYRKYKVAIRKASALLETDNANCE